MSTYLKLFETHAEYQSYSGGWGDSPFVKPNVSHCIEDNHVHYNPYIPPFFCKLKLNDGSTVELEGSGELTRAMVSDQYKGTLVSAEIGELCTSIGNGTFRECRSLTSITIPDSVTSIGIYAFDECTGLKSVIIGNGVTSIGNMAFQGCSGLTSITIPDDSVTSIGIYAFQGCSGLTSVTIGSGVTSIGDSAFRYCSGLISVTVEATTPPTLGSDVFNITNNCPIYVPAASVDTYKAATNWSTYASRIQAIPTT